MYGPYKFYSSILGYKTSSAVRNDFTLGDYTPGVYDFSHQSPGYAIPFFKFSIKLAARTNGPLNRSHYNGIWQNIDLSFMAGKVTTIGDIVDYLNKNLKFVVASADTSSRLILSAERCTDNPEEEAIVDFLVISGDTRLFGAQRTDYSTAAIKSASIFPVARIGGQTTGIPNIINTGFALSTDKLAGKSCPSIYPDSSNKIQTSGTLGYITCCDGYTPNTAHRRGVWDLTTQIEPVLFIRMINSNTTVDAGGPVVPVYAGILAVKLSKMVYTSQQIADTINMALDEISPCGKSSDFVNPCSVSDGTLPFKAMVSADGRIMICQSFYELSIHGSYSYLDNIFAFDKISEGNTCTLKAGYTLKNIPSGCAVYSIPEAKSPAEITAAIAADEARLANSNYETFEYSPSPIVQKISDYTSRNISYAYAPTMTGPLSENIFALSNQATSLSSKLWIKSQYIPDSNFSEFWATFDLSEDGIYKAIGKEVNILKVLSVSASVKASWDIFGYPAGVYISYPFYNWALVLNSSTYCKVKPLPNSDSIYFSPEGIICRDFGADRTAKIKPSWDGNTESLQYIRARNKSCNTDMTQVSTVEIPRVYGHYRMGVAFDWRFWSRYNPKGVNNTDFSGAFAIPSITFKIAYY